MTLETARQSLIDKAAKSEVTGMIWDLEAESSNYQRVKKDWKKLHKRLANPSQSEDTQDQVTTSQSKVVPSVQREVTDRSQPGVAAWDFVQTK